MRFLLIEDDARYRHVLRYHIEVEWPDAVVEEYHPAFAGPMPDSQPLHDFDMILLGHPLKNERGFEWLEELRAHRGCPPVIVFADPSDELLAVDALKRGAASYFPKSLVTHARLIKTIRAETAAAGTWTPATSAKFGDRTGTSHYRFVELLHATDMASVYLAEDETDGSELAVKLIRYVPDSGGGKLFDRFVQEYEIIAGLAHPNVVKIFDLGIADDHAFIAMEYLPAGSLSQRLNGAVEPAAAVGYARQIAGALDAVHAAGILHRDLKPANIMFRDDGSLALIDFGLAKQMKLAAALTGAGQIFGTPYYMSPEQGHAEATDERSDLYSLGCLFYEMLTGSRPFVAASAMGVIYKHANAERPRLPSAVAICQPVLDRLLAVAAEDRFQSAAELMPALDDVAQSLREDQEPAKPALA